MTSFTIIDPLYGFLRHGPDESLQAALYQTEAMSRLRDISLSSVPSRMSQTGHAPSRFEHSVGVAHLAKELCRKRPAFAPWKNELVAASLLHDTGSVPFSHTAEIFQHDATGLTHEEAVKDILQENEIKRILKSHSVDPSNILALIEGRHPNLNGLLAGSIDLDNLDNSARLIRSVGWVKEPPYEPSELIDAFRFRGGQVVIESEYLQQLMGWVRCREQLYGSILYQENKLSAACMLYKALEFAYDAGNLDQEFFKLGEGDALSYLRSSRCPKNTRDLVERCIRWQFYDLGWEQIRVGQNPKITRLSSDWLARKEFADQIAKSLKIKPERVCVHAGRDKGIKPIHLQFHGRYASACETLFSKREMKQRLSVFLHPDVRADQDRVADIVFAALEPVKELEEEHGHNFS